MDDNKFIWIFYILFFLGIYILYDEVISPYLDSFYTVHNGKQALLKYDSDDEEYILFLYNKDKPLGCFVLGQTKKEVYERLEIIDGTISVINYGTYYFDEDNYVTWDRDSLKFYGDCDCYDSSYSGSISKKEFKDIYKDIVLYDVSKKESSKIIVLLFVNGLVIIVLLFKLWKYLYKCRKIKAILRYGIVSSYFDEHHILQIRKFSVHEYVECRKEFVDLMDVYELELSRDEYKYNMYVVQSVSDDKKCIVSKDWLLKKVGAINGKYIIDNIMLGAKGRNVKFSINKDIDNLKT